MKKLSTYFVSYVHVIFQKVAIIIFHGISVLFRPHFKSKSIWIIMERGFEAQDNAWHFFRYLKNSHPEVDARFAIVRSSPDYATNLSPYKSDILEYGSLKYFIVLFNAKYLISTHLQTYVYYNSIYQWFSHSIFDIKAKKIFLQHGITPPRLQLTYTQSITRLS